MGGIIIWYLIMTYDGNVSVPMQSKEACLTAAAHGDIRSVKDDRFDVYRVGYCVNSLTGEVIAP